MTVAPSLSLPHLNLHSSFLCCPLKSFSCKPSSATTRILQLKPTSYPRIRALELDQNTVVAITVGVVSVAVGIGIPVFYETQIDNASKRDNTQPCFPCNGSGARNMEGSTCGCRVSQRRWRHSLSICSNEAKSNSFPSIPKVM